MSSFKNSIKKIPILSGIYFFVRDKSAPMRLKMKGPEKIFSDIYKRNLWQGSESISGAGSDYRQTETIIKELPKLFKKFKIKSILDIPCGDFNWMREVNLENIQYTGADIVKEMIDENNRKFAKSGVQFIKKDLIEEPLPQVDLIFCRDCFIHLSYNDIFQSLENICQSGATYLLTTTFTERSDENDIATGQWRIVNLEKKPFNFLKPVDIINENCTEGNGLYKDKSLGLWVIEEIKKKLNQRN